METEIQLLSTSQPLVYDEVINTYTKGFMYCIFFKNSEGEQVTHKYPSMNIFRVIEPYPDSEKKR